MQLGILVPRRAGVRVLPVRARRRCSSIPTGTPEARARPARGRATRRSSSATTARPSAMRGGRGARRCSRAARRRCEGAGGRRRGASDAAQRRAGGRARQTVALDQGAAIPARRPTTPTTCSSASCCAHLPAGLIGLVFAAMFAASMNSSVGGAQRAHLDHGGGRLPPAGAGWPRTGGTTCACRASSPWRWAAFAGGVRRVREPAGIADRGGQHPRLAVLRHHPRHLPHRVLPASAWAGRAVFAGGARGRGGGRSPASSSPTISFLWYNLIGCALVMAVGAGRAGAARDPREAGIFSVPGLRSASTGSYS